MALQRIWIPSPCYHGGSSKRLIVLHTAEGARTIEDLGHFFQNYNNQVSSHTGADDKLGKIGEYVSRGNSSWTCANYNNASVQMELCAFASWSTAEWKNNHHNMLRNCADWIREESQKLGIPITKLNASQAQGNGRGVCQHRDLGAGGGGHTDCGNGFPIDYVLDMAKGTTAPPTPKKYEEEQGNLNMQIVWGTDNKAGLAIPQHAVSLRLVCSQGGQVKVEWPKGEASSATVDLGGQHRSDSSVPKGQDGQVLLTRVSGTGPVSAVWILPA